MRIVMLRSNPVDPDPRVEKEAAALVKAGHAVTVVGWDRAGSYGMRRAELLRLPGPGDMIEVPRWLVGIPSSFGSGLANAGAILAFGRALAGFLREHRDAYDCIHACDLDTGLVARRAARDYGKALVYDVFDYYADSHAAPGPLRALIVRAENAVINAADAVLICSEQRCAQLAGAHPRRVTVVENSSVRVTPQPLPRTPTQEGTCRLVYVGVLTPDRFIERILDAVAAEPALSLDIAGFGALEQRAREAAQACPRIVFHSKVGYARALQIEAGADALLAPYDPSVPNNRLAAPNKFYEALMLGVPLIGIAGTSVGAWATELGVGAALKPDFTPGDLRAAAEGLRGRNAGGAVAARGHELYDTRFGWPIMERRLLNAYSEIICERGLA